MALVQANDGSIHSGVPTQPEIKCADKQPAASNKQASSKFHSRPMNTGWSDNAGGKRLRRQCTGRGNFAGLGSSASCKSKGAKAK
jgi:hypothetical protein